MSEYIIEWSGIGGQLARLLNDNVPLVLWPKKIREERQREEVVRCRDCNSPSFDEFGGGWCNENCREVKPWDFCAWGERRERESAEVWNQWSADDVTCSEES